MLQNVTNCYKMLHDPKICYIFPKYPLSKNFIKIGQLEAEKKQNFTNVTKCYKMLQNVTKCYMTKKIITYFQNVHCPKISSKSDN